ncbi:response regulator [Cellulosimicrobium arenosum]|uniref:Response regulator transcription factor n=1 Tax=Cellulosimicrobium arenosum TaxID=2708133 RepID=A0A927G8E5_9MICO|nr:response regulator transcription factor [Cellulosimicrobium arenosum]MBD8078469.1 response regulator transcription factor [Cellulosimicrobium arenosum]
MTRTERIRIVLVDDEPLVRTGLRAILEAEPDLDVVGEAGDGVEVPGLVEAARPDVVLMDVRMPRVDGIAATSALLARDPAPRVLVVTTFENDDHVLDALRAGAHGFLLKRARPEEFVQAVRVVARGESLLFPDAVRRLATARPPAGDELRAARLTEREGEVLRLMATGLSNAEIAGRLYLGVETVRTHVGNVLAKLGVRDRTQAVVHAYESGFVRTG